MCLFDIKAYCSLFLNKHYYYYYYEYTMVIYCVAFNCRNEQDHRKISFHGFPFKRPDVLQLWIQAVRRKNWTPSKFSKLCGEHFLPRDYIPLPGSTTGRKLLKPDAVPSVFPHLTHELAKPRGKNTKVCLDDQKVCEINYVKIEDVDIVEQFTDENEVHNRESFIIKDELGDFDIKPQQVLEDSTSFNHQGDIRDGIISKLDVKQEVTIF